MRALLAIAIAAGLCSASGAAVAAPQSHSRFAFDPPDAEPCFRSEQAIRFQGESNQSLILRTSIGRYYRIGFAASCPNVMRKDMSVTLINRGGSSEVCQPIDLRIVSTASQFPMECAIASIQPLTGAEARALPVKVRP